MKQESVIFARKILPIAAMALKETEFRGIVGCGDYSGWIKNQYAFVPEGLDLSEEGFNNLKNLRTFENYQALVRKIRNEFPRDLSPKEFMDIIRCSTPVALTIDEPWSVSEPIFWQIKELGTFEKYQEYVKKLK